MQMTDSGFTVNDWRRRFGGGGAGHDLFRLLMFIAIAEIQVWS